MNTGSHSNLLPHQNTKRAQTLSSTIDDSASQDSTSLFTDDLIRESSPFSSSQPSATQNVIEEFSIHSSEASSDCERRDSLSSLVDCLFETGDQLLDLSDPEIYEKLPYHSPLKFFLQCFDERRIPGDLVGIFEEANCKFIEGHLVVDMYDYRKTSQTKPNVTSTASTSQNFQKHQVYLKPTNESLWADLRLMNEKNGQVLDDEQLVELESRLLTIIEPKLDLDPNYTTSIISHTLHRLENSHITKRKRSKYNSYEIELQRAEELRFQKLMRIKDERIYTEEFKPSHKVSSFLRTSQEKKTQRDQRPSRGCMPVNPNNKNENPNLLPRGIEIIHTIKYARGHEKGPIYSILNVYKLPNQRYEAILRWGTTQDTSINGQTIRVSLYGYGAYKKYIKHFKDVYSINNQLIGEVSQPINPPRPPLNQPNANRPAVPPYNPIRNNMRPMSQKQLSPNASSHIQVPMSNVQISPIQRTPHYLRPQIQRNPNIPTARGNIPMKAMDPTLASVNPSVSNARSPQVNMPIPDRADPNLKNPPLVQEMNSIQANTPSPINPNLISHARPSTGRPIAQYRPTLQQQAGRPVMNTNPPIPNAHSSETAAMKSSSQQNLNSMQPTTAINPNVNNQLGSQGANYTPENARPIQVNRNPQNMVRPNIRVQAPVHGVNYNPRNNDNRPSITQTNINQQHLAQQSPQNQALKYNAGIVDAIRAHMQASNHPQGMPLNAYSPAPRGLNPRISNVNTTAIPTNPNIGNVARQYPNNPYHLTPGLRRNPEAASLMQPNMPVTNAGQIYNGAQSPAVRIIKQQPQNPIQIRANMPPSSNNNNNRPYPTNQPQNPGLMHSNVNRPNNARPYSNASSSAVHGINQQQNPHAMQPNMPVPNSQPPSTGTINPRQSPNLMQGSVAVSNNPSPAMRVMNYQPQNTNVAAGNMQATNSSRPPSNASSPVVRGLKHHNENVMHRSPSIPNALDSNSAVQSPLAQKAMNHQSPNVNTMQGNTPTSNPSRPSSKQNSPHTQSMALNVQSYNTMQASMNMSQPPMQPNHQMTMEGMGYYGQNMSNMMTSQAQVRAHYNQQLMMNSRLAAMAGNANRNMNTNQNANYRNANTFNQQAMNSNMNMARSNVGSVPVPVQAQANMAAIRKYSNDNNMTRTNSNPQLHANVDPSNPYHQQFQNVPTLYPKTNAATASNNNKAQTPVTNSPKGSTPMMSKATPSSAPNNNIMMAGYNSNQAMYMNASLAGTDPSMFQPNPNVMNMQGNYPQQQQQVANQRPLTTEQQKQLAYQRALQQRQSMLNAQYMMYAQQQALLAQGQGQNQGQMTNQQQQQMQMMMMMQRAGASMGRGGAPPGAGQIPNPNMNITSNNQGRPLAARPNVTIRPKPNANQSQNQNQSMMQPQPQPHQQTYPNYDPNAQGRYMQPHNYQS